MSVDSFICTAHGVRHPFGAVFALRRFSQLVNSLKPEMLGCVVRDFEKLSWCV